MINRARSLSAVLLPLFLLTSCSNGGGGGSESSESGAPLEAAASRSNCGFSVDGQLVDSFSSEQSVRGTLVEIAAGNPISILTDAGPLLVQLPGIGITEEPARARFRNALDRFLGRSVTVALGTTPCSQTYRQGVPGVVAHVVTDSGLDLSEYLVSQGFVRSIGSGNACEATGYRTCFSALIESTVPRSAGEITDFLWKPQSDGGFNPGLLVVLVSACDVDVLVNGVQLIDFGASNDRCTTARSLETSGCGFGANAQVEVLDRKTGAPYLFPGGQSAFTVPDGCARTEFKL